MTSLKGLWESHKDDDWGEGDLSYDDLVISMGVEIVSSKEFGSYQGDYVYRVRGDQGDGILIIGYGSCSGCDALYGALGYGSVWTEDMERDVTALRDQLQAEIMWADEGTMRERVEREESSNWYCHEEEMKVYLRDLAKEIDASMARP